MRYSFFDKCPFAHYVKNGLKMWDFRIKKKPNEGKVNGDWYVINYAKEHIMFLKIFAALKNNLSKVRLVGICAKESRDRPVGALTDKKPGIESESNCVSRQRARNGIGCKPWLTTYGTSRGTHTTLVMRLLRIAWLIF